MMELSLYNVPKEIERIENESSMDDLLVLENLIPSATRNVKEYLELQSAMIHLEECANSKPQRDFNQISISLEQLENNTFKMQYNVRNVYISLSF